ncbi:hypothetical protein [Actinomyces capricornis]|nr:hypothetical protein [Actinomyces capricornis]
MKVKNWIKDGSLQAGLIPVYSAVLAFLLSLALDWIFGRSDPWLAVACVVSVFVVYILTSLTVHARYVAPVERASRRIDERVDLFLRKADFGGFEWIVDNAYLKAVEAGESVEEVWIVSVDLAGDLERGDFVDVVRRNIQRGVKYVYFIPDNRVRFSKVAALKDVYKSNPLIKVQSLNGDFFFLVKDLDFIIYNPTGSSRSGFMGLPVDDGRGRWTARISDSLMDVLVGKLNEFLENGGSSVKW